MKSFPQLLFIFPGPRGDVYKKIGHSRLHLAIDEGVRKEMGLPRQGKRI